jgi:hypothetical protein
MRLTLLREYIPGSRIITSCHEKGGIGPDFGHRDHFGCDLGYRAVKDLFEFIGGLPIGLILIDFFRMPLDYARQVQEKLFSMFPELTKRGLIDANTIIILLNNFGAIENGKIDPSRYFDEVQSLRKEEHPWYVCTTQYLEEMNGRGYDVTDLDIQKQLDNGMLDANFPFIRVRLSPRATQSSAEGTCTTENKRTSKRPRTQTKRLGFDRVASRAVKKRGNKAINASGDRGPASDSENHESNGAPKGGDSGLSVTSGDLSGDKDEEEDDKEDEEEDDEEDGASKGGDNNSSVNSSDLSGDEDEEEDDKEDEEEDDEEDE